MINLVISNSFNTYKINTANMKNAYKEDLLSTTSSDIDHQKQKYSCRLYDHRSQFLSTVRSLDVIDNLVVRCPIPHSLRKYLNQGRYGVKLVGEQERNVDKKGVVEETIVTEQIKIGTVIVLSTAVKRVSGMSNHTGLGSVARPYPVCPLPMRTKGSIGVGREKDGNRLVGVKEIGEIHNDRVKGGLRGYVSNTTTTPNNVSGNGTSPVIPAALPGWSSADHNNKQSPPAFASDMIHVRICTSI